MRLGRRAGGVVERLPGRAWTLLLDDVEGGGRPIRIGLAEYAAGGAAPASIHDDEDEILVPLRGHGTLDAAGREETLQPGDVAFVGAGEEHAIRADAESGLELVAIFLRTNGAGPRPRGRP